MKRKPWNRCDICGKFIPLTDFGSFLSGQPTEGPAVRRLITPDAEGTWGTWETLCKDHGRAK